MLECVKTAKLHIKLSHTVNNTLLSRRFSLDLGPIQVHMLLSSPLIPFYLCKAWVHEDDISIGFQVHFIDYLPY